ncbi:FAS1 domain-containing protein [Podospora australis]|uniref:FAS1 domain-containing protein n=1 Tax=Podospora australis TaxID=1536484 RepID=A0AAN7AGG4_9PEZI|nr:FAS1 domain-containing protein [Podospora australis]
MFTGSLLAVLAVLPLLAEAASSSPSRIWPWTRTPQEKRQTKALGAVLAGQQDLSTYYSLIKQYPDILLQLPNFAGVTLIAPSNEAFNNSHEWNPDNATLVTNLLQYHILTGTVNTAALVAGPSTLQRTLLTNKAYTNVSSGQNVVVAKQHDDLTVLTSGLGTRSTIIEPDIAFTGGFIQMVDTLLIPPVRLEITARDAYKELTAFLGALYSTGLAEEISNMPNITILAPRNTAFQSISSSLSALSESSLRDVLKYHIIPNNVIPSSGFLNGTTLSPLLGKESKIFITQIGNNLYFNRAQMLQADILLANGVLHMIDNVLSQNASDTRPDEESKTQPPVFAQTGLTSTGTRHPVPYTSFLPCTTEGCPVSTSTTESSLTAKTTVVSTRSSSALAGRVTGLGMAVVGMGMGMGVMGVV